MKSEVNDNRHGRRILIGALLSLVLLAGSRIVAQPLPLPPALMTATTAIVINEGVNQPVYERLILELRAWKRFTLVDDPSHADITITIDGESGVGSVYNVWTGQTHVTNAQQFRLSFKQGDTVLYRDTLRGCCSLKAMTRKTLERLDQRMRQQ